MPRPTRDESRDTGMALVLVLLLLLAFLVLGWWGLVTGAVGLLVLTMTVPRVFGPAAIVWLGLAHRLGQVVSTVLLTLVFALVVTPIGLLRRWMGKDTLRLRRFKGDDESVMVERRHTFRPADLERPY